MDGAREIALVAVIGVCTAGALLVPRLRSAPGLWAALLVGAMVRIGVAILARSITPRDVEVYFHLAAVQVLVGRDPALVLPGRQWNFLPLMPYAWALALKTGLAWTTVMKVVPIACDLVNIWLVGLLCNDAGRRPVVRLAYALNPVAILVVALHGQVEPTAIMFLLAGMVLLRRKADLGAGVLFGLAIATKTWPVLVVLPVLAATPRRAWKPVLSAAAVLAALFVSSVVLLHSAPRALLKALASYGSHSGFWGWGGMIASFDVKGSIGYDTPETKVGIVLVLIAVVAMLVLFRKANDLRRAWTTPAAALMVTGGFGVQYLMWPVPFLTANEERQGLYLVSATAFALFDYLPLFHSQSMRQAFVSGFSWLVIAAIAQMLLRAHREQAAPASSTSSEGGPGLAQAGVA